MAKKKKTKASEKTVKSHPTCDPGFIWSELQQKCVPDIGAKENEGA